MIIFFCIVATIVMMLLGTLLADLFEPIIDILEAIFGATPLPAFVLRLGATCGTIYVADHFLSTVWYVGIIAWWIYYWIIVVGTGTKDYTGY